MSATERLSPSREASREAGDTCQWVVFTLDTARYAVPLESTERIVRAAEVTPLPSAPAVVMGAVSVAGTVLPVFDLRRRFGLPERPLSPADHFLIARTERRTVALAIDVSLGVIQQRREDIVARERLGTHMPHIHGVLPLADGLVLIHDLEQFLSPGESRDLENALGAEGKRGD